MLSAASASADRLTAVTISAVGRWVQAKSTTERHRQAPRRRPTHSRPALLVEAGTADRRIRDSRLDFGLPPSAVRPWVPGPGGERAMPGMSHYVSAKHGVIGVMRSLAVELGEHSIRVSTVLPTNVNTPMFMNEGVFRMYRPDLESPGPDDIRAIAQQMHVLPVGWVEPVDISNAIVFLASDESRFITGVELPIDAGALLK
jgi:NAD(P)-dependent dehydrogenase (short-subunit alcohol dehydrogenase family)